MTEKHGGKGDGSSGHRVKTGDQRYLMLWESLMTVSMLGLMLMVFLRRRSRKER